MNLSKLGLIPARSSKEFSMHTVNARETLRVKLESDTEAFIAKGGAITFLDSYLLSGQNKLHYGRGAAAKGYIQRNPTGVL